MLELAENEVRVAVERRDSGDAKTMFDAEVCCRAAEGKGDRNDGGDDDALEPLRDRFECVLFMRRGFGLDGTGRFASSSAKSSQEISPPSFSSSSSSSSSSASPARLSASTSLCPHSRSSSSSSLGEPGNGADGRRRLRVGDCLKLPTEEGASEPRRLAPQSDEPPSETSVGTVEDVATDQRKLLWVEPLEV